MSNGHSSRLLQLALFALAGCMAEPETRAAREYGAPRVLAAELGAMHNVSMVDSVWIGSFPTPADLDLARRRGIETVIDLSLADEGLGYDVPEECARLGLAHVSAGVESAGAGNARVPDAAVDVVLAELSRAHDHPILMFCANGTRAAMLFAIWRTLEGGVPVEDALVEGRRAGMKPGASEDFVRSQVARLSAGATPQ